jgi:hypothetical protein
MRNMILAAILGIFGCSTSSTSDDSDGLDAATVGDGSIGGGDSGGDAPFASHAPCPTCCDPIAQTGCGADEACYHDETTQLTYCASAGAGQLDATCVADTSCAAGFDCTYPAQFAKCRKFCTSNADCPGTPGMTQCVLNVKPPENPYGICF